MSTTFDRLRRLSALRSRAPDPADDPAVGLPAYPGRGRLEELVPGELVSNPYGTCYLTAQAYPLSDPRGAYPLGRLLELEPAIFAPFHPQFALDRANAFTHAAFIDTETTGLGTGAGVYSFMVGVGTFERVQFGNDTVRFAEPHWAVTGSSPTHFVVRQFFMRHPGEEPALLAALADTLSGADLAVTFNGRSFDLPLLRARYSHNRRLLAGVLPELPLLADNQPHLDLLMPARRLWKRRAESCRLTNLERVILEYARSEDDVPGSLIPELYLAYMRTGNAAEMRRVFYHNREDVMTMVALTDRLGHAFAQRPDSLDAGTLPALDWMSLGQCYEHLERHEAALVAYRRALDLLPTNTERGETFARLSSILKRQGRWQEAADMWQLWLTTVPGDDPTPYIELAKYCEWQIEDLEQAAMWAGWALHNLQRSASRLAWSHAIAELEHRLARLRRKQQGLVQDQGHIES